MLNKKSQTSFDNIFLIIFLFALAIGCVVSIFIYSAIVDKFKIDPTINSTQGTIQAMEDVQAAQNNYDYAILIVYLGFTIAMMILGYFLPTDSVYYIIYICTMVIGILISAIISYVWGNFSTTVEFTTIVASQFKITNQLLTNAPLYYLFSCVISFIATFAKSKQVEQ